MASILQTFLSPPSLFLSQVSPQQLRDIVAGEQAREMFKEVRQVEEQIAELSVRAKRKQAEAC